MLNLSYHLVYSFRLKKCFISSIDSIYVHLIKLIYYAWTYYKPIANILMITMDIDNLDEIDFYGSPLITRISNDGLGGTKKNSLECLDMSATLHLTNIT